jgi:hypothetical protein
MQSEWSSWLGISEDKGKDLCSIVETIFDKDLKLQLGCDVGEKTRPTYDFAEFVQQIGELAQHALNALAASILLLDSEKQELSGLSYESGVEAPKQVRMSSKSGIAGWVMGNGKPLIVNDCDNSLAWNRGNRGFDNDIRLSIRSIICAPIISHCKIIGVIEVFNKLNGDNFTENDSSILMHIANTAAMAIDRSQKQRSIIEEVKSTIKALAAAIDAKDPYTRGHSQRVVQYSLMCGRSLSLSPRELEIIEYSGILHDIGKIGIPDAILSKPGLLTDEERFEIRKHPVISTNIIHDIPFLKPVIEIVRHHHEKYDGSGYPDGLVGESIPKGARVLAVADAFDAMMSDRPYRAHMTQNHAIIELRKYTGKQFCPIAVDAFLFALETEPGLYEWRSRR